MCGCVDGAPEWPWGLCGGWGWDAGRTTQPASPEGLACSGSPVCREGVGRQVEGVDPPFLPITRTPGGRTLGLGLGAGSRAPGLRAGCCGGLSTGPLRCLTPAFTLMNVRLRKGLQENYKDFPPALHSSPQTWMLTAFAFSPLPLLPLSLPPSQCVCLTLTHIHTHVHTSLCSLCRPRLCASWLCFRKDPGGMQGGLGRGRLPPELPARGRRPGRGTPGCSEGCREPTVSYRILSTDVRALSRSKAVQGPFFRLLAVTEITVEGSEVAQWRPALRPPGRSPPGSSVHGILQASILEWVAISFSRGSSRSRDWTMKLMSDLTDSATLSSHPACDNPEFREEQMGHFRSPTAGGTGWGPNAGCPALASPPGTAPAAMPRTPPRLHSTSTSSGLGVGDVCFAHLQGTEVGGWLGHPRLQRPRSPDLPRPAPWLRGRGSVSAAATRPPRQGLVTTLPHSVAEKADFANLLFKSREVTKIKQKRRETGLGRGKGGSQK